MKKIFLLPAFILFGILGNVSRISAENAPLSNLRVLRRTETSLTILWNSPLRTAVGISPAAKANPLTHRITVIDKKTGKTVKRIATSQSILTITNLKEDHDYVVSVRGGYASKNKPALTKSLTTQ